jgi:DNA-binding LacI/PurR family transcriptional regulator
LSQQKLTNMEAFARASGISRPTVSKYFHNPGSVRESTRAKIEKALETYDYSPNVYAMNQNRRLTKTVGIVVPYLADPFFAEIARAIERRCMEEGFSPLLFSSHGEAGLEADILQHLRSLKPAGVLLAPLGRGSDRAAVEAFCAAVPTILFDSNLEGVGEAFVGSDNASFVNQSVDYLVRSGSEPCLFEMLHPANPNARKRRAAYLDAMARHGMEPRIVGAEGQGWDFERIGYEGGLHALDARALPTDTVLCSNDRLAIGFLAACYERGLRVGRGTGCALRVASHDDHPFSRYTSPALTTVAHDYAAVSASSVETLLALVEGGGRFAARTEALYPARLVLRDSA